MSRSRKFKAWDKVEKKWFQPTFEAYVGRLEEVLITLDGDLMLRTLSGCAHESTFPDRFELVDWTGLNDKDGNNIFEGDLVKVTIQQLLEDIETVGVVEIQPGAAYVDFPEYGTSIRIDAFEEMEIVGNIYENPELLKGAEG